MRVIRTKRFDQAYAKLPAEIQRQAVEQLLRLEVDPQHPSLHTHKRRGEGDVWQARVTRSYRLFFRMEGDTITLIDVGPHEK
jgi:mRNA-degrading endonuclease RelE of RelBE toxin-antitoxin system